MFVSLRTNEGNKGKGNKIVKRDKKEAEERMEQNIKGDRREMISKKKYKKILGNIFR